MGRDEFRVPVDVQGRYPLQREDVLFECVISEIKDSLLRIHDRNYTSPQCGRRVVLNLNKFASIGNYER